MTTHPHIRNFYNSIGQAADISGDGTEVLKIAIDLQSIRYFILSGANVIFYGDHTLHDISDMDALAGQLTNILSKDSFLNKPFAKVSVCWSTGFEIIPSIYFDESEMNANTASQEIMNGEANFIFELPHTFSTILSSHFQTCHHRHSGAAMIEMIRQQGRATPDQLYINVRAGSVAVLYFDDSSTLLLYNEYEYKSVEDYIYFVLLAADELRIDRQETKAMLMGDISRDSLLYNITYRYFMHVSFMTAPDGVTFGRAFDEYPEHLNYPLYNL